MITLNKTRTMKLVERADPRQWPSSLTGDLGRMLDRAISGEDAVRGAGCFGVAQGLENRRLASSV